jgi:hypothetical protein
MYHSQGGEMPSRRALQGDQVPEHLDNYSHQVEPRTVQQAVCVQVKQMVGVFGNTSFQDFPCNQILGAKLTAESLFNKL